MWKTRIFGNLKWILPRKISWNKDWIWQITHLFILENIPLCIESEKYRATLTLSAIDSHYEMNDESSCIAHRLITSIMKCPKIDDRWWGISQLVDIAELLISSRTKKKAACFSCQISLIIPCYERFNWRHKRDATFFSIGSHNIFIFSSDMNVLWR